MCTVHLNDQDLETPQFCTQYGLETINFQPKEDELLIQSCLNISKDTIVGIDKKGDSFWKRIGETYNNHRQKNFPERKPMTLKGR
jgi:hypothetical protein